MSYLQRAKELREKAGRLVTEARGLQDKAVTEKRDLTKEELDQFNRLMDESEGAVEQAQASERLVRSAASDDNDRERRERRSRLLASGAANPLEGESRTADPENRRATQEYHEAFLRGLSRGSVGLSAEQRATLQLDSDIGGGIFAPSDVFINNLIQNVDDRVVVRTLADVVSVPMGTSLGRPTLDGDISDFEWGAGELTAAAEDTGLKFGKREWRPYRLQRKLIKISRELLENAPDVQSIVVARIGYALARTLEKAYMTGNGQERPLGLFVASDDGIPTTRDVNSGDAAALTGDGLMTAQDTLKDQYQANARWLAHRTIITKVRQLKDGNGQYLWRPGLDAGQPNMILGAPYVKSEFAPSTYTNGNYVMLYGDFAFYAICDALGGMRIQRLLEVYATTGQVGLVIDNAGGDAMPVLSEAFVRVKLAA